MKYTSWLAVVAVAACGGGNATPDAAKPADARKVDAGSDDHRDSSVDAEHVDAAPATVKTVSCTANPPNATVTTVDTAFAYSPVNTPIKVNDVIEFKMSATHNVAPDHAVGATTDSGLEVGFGSDACLQFTAAGTFSFECTAHGFVGTATVTQ